MTITKANTSAVFLALALGMALLPQPVDARGGHGERASFETLDADGNGEVTQAEMEAYRAERFSAADTDQDGALSKEELSARMSERANDRAARWVERMMERMDANDDGKLSQDELASRGGRKAGDRFERLDADGSGGVSKEEFETAMKKHRGHGGRFKK